MATHLHPEKWKELEHDFELAKLFSGALALIEKTELRTDGVSRAQYFAHHGLLCLHPVTRDPAALEEYEQRKAGTFKAGGGAQPAPAPQDAQLRQMAAQIAELQRQLAERAPPAPPKPNEGGGGGTKPNEGGGT